MVASDMLYKIDKILRACLKVVRTIPRAQRDFLFFSNFLPLERTYGLVLDPGVPGAGPKCFLASLSLEALSKTVLVPINH